uniref:RING-type domain-containing protein n=1 Tax=Paramoeba aestuarina TaxID=180227 RepID=A0A7S4K5P5_9EUKA
MGGCEAQILPEMIDAALPRDTKKWYDAILLQNAVKRAKGKAIECPACQDVEVTLPEDKPKPQPIRPRFTETPQFRMLLSVGVLLFYAGCLYYWRPYTMFFGTLLFGGKVRQLLKPRHQLAEYMERNREKEKEQEKQHFCKQCKISFCLSCESYHPLEGCQQLGRPGGGTLEGLRLHIEEQMSQVAVRICPECGAQFQKDGGCNKMTCVCGYSMCYICRKNLQKEGYSHYCNHFRPDGGKCTQCNKCELFRAPNDDALCIQVAKRAKREYLAMYPKLGKEGKNLNTVAGVRFE